MLGLRLRVGEAARGLRARHLDLEEGGSGLRRRLRVRVVHSGCVAGVRCNRAFVYNQ